MKYYRRLYEQHYGPIPEGYDIHHIDGNKTNNDPSNLQACSRQEHYDIHWKQGDYNACALLTRGLEKTPHELRVALKKRNRQNQLKLMSDGRHNFLGERNPSKKMINDGTHHFLGNKNPIYERTKKGMNPFQRKDVIDGVRKRQQIERICPWCGKMGKTTAMFRHHFDRCKMK